MKRAAVEGFNGSWTFVFSERVKHGNGARKVEIHVPVLQLLELADQFRACPGGPGHTVYHLQMTGRPKTCPRSAHTDRERFFFCRHCRCMARQTDVDDELCPTCGKKGLVEADDRCLKIEADGGAWRRCSLDAGHDHGHDYRGGWLTVSERPAGAYV